MPDLGWDYLWLLVPLTPVIAFGALYLVGFKWLR